MQNDTTFLHHCAPLMRPKWRRDCPTSYPTIRPCAVLICLQRKGGRERLLFKGKHSKMEEITHWSERAREEVRQAEAGISRFPLWLHATETGGGGGGECKQGDWQSLKSSSFIGVEISPDILCYAISLPNILFLFMSWVSYRSFRTKKTKNIYFETWFSKDFEDC